MKYQPTDRSTIVEKDMVESIKEQASTIEIEATDGISLKCGGNVLTIDSSGISLKGSMVDTNASSDGVTAGEVSIPDIEKPLYNKLKVTALKASLTKQDDITQLLTFTATVEKFEDGSWSETTDLNETQMSQINWYFIKNNDEQDTDVLTDNPTDDTITIDGLEMSVTLNEENIYRFGHAHAFVVDSDVENGHGVSELVRSLEVINILTKGSTDSSKAQCKAIFNVGEATQDELAQVRWNINGVEKPELNGKDDIKYDLKEEKRRDVPFRAYIDGKPDEAAVIIVSHDVQDEHEKENSQAQEDKKEPTQNNMKDVKL